MQKTLLASSSAAALLGPKTRSPACLEGVDDAGRQGGLRPDDGQADLVLLGELDQGREIVGRDGHVFAVDVGAGVARGDEHPLGPGTLSDLPGQGVFPPPVADNQDIHDRMSLVAGRLCTEYHAILVSAAGAQGEGAAGPASPETPDVAYT